MFIKDPDPELEFLVYPSRIPDPGVKKAPDPGSSAATLSETICSESILVKTQISLFFFFYNFI
jgi:hypothetical protein